MFNQYQLAQLTTPLRATCSPENTVSSYPRVGWDVSRRESARCPQTLSRTGFHLSASPRTAPRTQFALCAILLAIPYLRRRSCIKKRVVEVAVPDVARAKSNHANRSLRLTFKVDGVCTSSSSEQDIPDTRLVQRDAIQPTSLAQFRCQPRMLLLSWTNIHYGCHDSLPYRESALLQYMGHFGVLHKVPMARTDATSFFARRRYRCFVSFFPVRGGLARTAPGS